MVPTSLTWTACAAHISPTSEHESALPAHVETSIQLLCGKPGQESLIHGMCDDCRRFKSPHLYEVLVDPSASPCGARSTGWQVPMAPPDHAPNEKANARCC